MNNVQRFTSISVVASAFAVWFYIVTQVQPDRNDFLTLLAFFASFIIWLGSSIALALYYLRLTKNNREVIYAIIAPSLRQGFIVSTTLAIILFLSFIDVIGIWEIGLVIILAIVLELTLANRAKLQVK